jgi:hypothetical protein
MRLLVRTRVHALIWTVVAGSALLLLGGCQDPLFPPDAPRTQFEIYDRMRNDFSPSDQPDVFGRPQPALRERLSQS